MRTARRGGLTLASAERRVASGREFLLVERFDRATGANGLVLRVHQEDMCQALGVPTRLTYQSEGGPSLPDCFGVLTAHVRRPAVDRLELLRATLFNVLIGNADAHAKNFSLMHGDGGDSSLAALRSAIDPRVRGSQPQVLDALGVLQRIDEMTTERCEITALALK